MSGRYKILCVDDEPDIRLIAEMSLKMNPALAVESAGSGEEAVAILTADPDRFDLVLIDVMMPGLDGPGVLGRLRGNVGTAHIPLVFMTAQARPQDVAALVEQGAAGVITKPFDPIALAGKVLEFLPR
jgi:two-component system OmpR family response regulator